MENDNLYFNLEDTAKKEMIINNLLETFLAVRKQVDFPSNSKGFDEDVNLYIAHLLFAISLPNYTTITEQYISLHAPEVLVLADMAEDQYLKYFIYKVNADNLLVHIGIYQDLAYRCHHKDQGKAMESFIADAKDFYMRAVQLNRKIYRRKTAIADVLSKLAKNFEDYLTALNHMRKEFFLFLNRFEDTEFGAFLDTMKKYERRMEFETKQNIFLDLYAQWLKKKSERLRVEINSLCKELHEIDPSFSFLLD